MPATASLGRRLAVALISAGMAISSPFAVAAQADSGSDLVVGLSAVGVPLVLPGAIYTVSVTNNGPEPLTSATVVVQLDRHVGLTGTVGSSCPLNTKAATLTCSFGALSVGSTATLRSAVYFSIREDRRTLEAIATLTASVPTDPNGGDNTDTATCWYFRPGEGSTWPPAVTCEAP